MSSCRCFSSPPVLQTMEEVKPKRRPLVRAASEESSSDLSSISWSPSRGDTLPWNLPKHHRMKRSKSASGDVLDPAERAVIRIAGKFPQSTAAAHRAFQEEAPVNTLVRGRLCKVLVIVMVWSVAAAGGRVHMMVSLLFWLRGFCSTRVSSPHFVSVIFTKWDHTFMIWSVELMLCGPDEHSGLFSAA